MRPVFRVSGDERGSTPERIRSGRIRCWRARVGSLCGFVNPGDLRVVGKTCAGSACHDVESKNVSRSMMTHGAMLWAAALYNNGSFHLKDARFGESYSESGAPQTLLQTSTEEERRTKGLLSFLDPIPRWEISQPGNVLRVFERGGKRRLEVGLPDKEEEPGKPDKGLSPRGFGTAQRTDPVFSRVTENTSARSDAQLSRHERSSRRLSLVRLFRMSRHLRERSRSGALSFLQRRQEISDVHKPPTRRFRRTNQDIRSSISSRARFRRRSAWSVTCTRERTWSPLIRG